MATQSTAQPDRLRMASGDKLAPFIDVGGATEIGLVRRENTDFFLTGDLERSLILGPSSLSLAQGDTWTGTVQGKLLVVADGITGGGMGKVASAAAVDVIARYVTNVLPWLTEIREGDEPRLLEEVSHGLARCEKRIQREAAKRDRTNDPVGTTLTMAYIVWPTMFVVHLGDSRAYLYRAAELRQLTTDDTVAQRMVDREMLAPAQASQMPFRNMLTNSLNAAGKRGKMEHHLVRLHEGDQVLLCTNGLFRNVDPLQIKRALEDCVAAESAARTLVESANRFGGADNSTAVVARVSRPK